MSEMQTHEPGHGVEPRLYLEIVRGATRFPNRPVYEGVFLIGAGTNCDLRLGGTDTPAVHSIVRAEGRDVHIESLCRKPALRVNGQPRERTELKDGDRIQIGPIQMVAHFQTVPAAPALAEPGNGTGTGNDLQQLSAPQLIELLEQDLALVEQSDRAEADGVARLLEAATHVDTLQPAEETVSIVDPDEQLVDTHAEAEQLIAALNRIADDLNARVDHLQQKEDVYSEAAEDLLTMQTRFSSLLERVLQRLEQRDSPEHRRSA